MTRSEENQLSYGALVAGLILNGSGIFGIWLQGDFWRDWGGLIRGNLNIDDLYLVLGLPAGVTVTGALLCMWAVLGSPLAQRWTHRRRNLLSAGYALLLVAAIAAAAVLGAQHFWALRRP